MRGAGRAIAAVAVLVATVAIAVAGSSVPARATPSAPYGKTQVDPTYAGGAGHVDRPGPGAIAWVLQSTDRIVTIEQSNHAVVVNGQTEQRPRLTLRRITSDGAADTTFGSGGALIVDIDDAGFYVSVYRVLAGDKIFLAGPTSAQDLVTVRVTANGALDSYGVGGIGRISGLSVWTVATQVAALPDGSVVVNVTRYNYGATLVKLTPAGAVDSTFATGGLYSGEGFSDGLTEVPGGLVYSVVHYYSRGPTLGKLDADGHLVASFGSAGRLDLDQAEFYSGTNQIDVLYGDGHGGVILRQSDGSQMVLRRVSAAGALAATSAKVLFGPYAVDPGGNPVVFETYPASAVGVMMMRLSPDLSYAGDPTELASPMPAQGNGLPSVALRADGAMTVNAGDPGSSRFFRVFTSPPGTRDAPFGNLESTALSPNGLIVSGAAIDPNTPAPIEIDVLSDGALAGYRTADRPRSDIGAAYPLYGANHGFSFTVPLSAGSHNVCTYAISYGAGGNTLLGCQSVTVAANPFGQVDAMVLRPGGLSVQGWVIDPQTAGEVEVDILVDGQFAGYQQAQYSRPDVGQVFPGYGPNHGFEAAAVVPGGTHTICVYGINVGIGANQLLKCQVVDVPTSPFGQIDVDKRLSAGVGYLEGWAIDAQTRAGIEIDILVDGALAGYGPADRTRPDVASVFPQFGDRHGFVLTYALPAGPHNVCPYAINVAEGTNTPLGCTTVNG